MGEGGGGGRGKMLREVKSIYKAKDKHCVLTAKDFKVKNDLLCRVEKRAVDG